MTTENPDHLVPAEHLSVHSGVLLPLLDQLSASQILKLLCVSNTLTQSILSLERNLDPTKHFLPFVLSIRAQVQSTFTGAFDPYFVRLTRKFILGSKNLGPKHGLVSLTTSVVLVQRPLFLFVVD